MEKKQNSKTKELLEKQTIIEEILDEKKEESLKSYKINIKKNNTKQKIVAAFFVVISLLSYITYLIYQISNIENLAENLIGLIGEIIIALFILCFTIISFKSKNKRNIPFIILGSLLLTTYCIFNILYNTKFNKTPENQVLNFYNQNITYAKKWASKNHVDVIEIYEHSDIIPKYHVVSQNIESGTSTNNINKIILIISDGPNYQKEVIVPSFIGWEFNNVIKYIEDNFLNNVTINFITSNNKDNTVINQIGKGTMKRCDSIKIDFAKGLIEKTKIIDFTNKSLLYATSWLKMKGFKYKLEYDYHDKINKNYIISQDSIEDIKDPNNDIINLKVSKGKMIVLPDITKMKQNELNKFITENNLKINYNEIYHKDLVLGSIIDSDHKKGDIVETGDTINVTISKGRLEMIEIKTLTDFYLWADKNKISYQPQYEFSNNVKKDSIIKTSHKVGELIKEDDTIIIYISKGKSVTIPNFINMGKWSITEKCKSLNLSCSFSYGQLTEKTKRDIAINQSKKAGTIVAEGSNLSITLSSGIIEKVNIPNFINKTKKDIIETCKNIGLKCKFIYENNFSTKPKDIATKQSKNGIVNKGSEIIITLSKGAARTYTIVIDPNQLTSGNPEATKKTLQAKLANACPGVNFIYSFQPVNTGIGYLSPSSQIKVGSNKIIEGQTYKVIINSKGSN